MSVTNNIVHWGKAYFSSGQRTKNKFHCDRENHSSLIVANNIFHRGKEYCSLWLKIFPLMEKDWNNDCQVAGFPHVATALVPAAVGWFDHFNSSSTYQLFIFKLRIFAWLPLFQESSQWYSIFISTHSYAAPVVYGKREAEPYTVGQVRDQCLDDHNCDKHDIDETYWWDQ